MNYWLTTHYPLTDSEKEVAHFAVYLQDGDQEIAKDLKPGDHIFIYELLTGDSKVTRDGNHKRVVKRKEGKQGIIALVEATTELEVTDAKWEEYSNGRKRLWKWKAEAKRVSTAGFVRREDLLPVFGYAQKYVLKGFGDAHSGLKKLSKEEYDKLLSLFITYERKEKDGDDFSDLIKAATIDTSTFLRHEGVNGPNKGNGRVQTEGDDHLFLKNYIAANPSAVLGSANMKDIVVESPFSSGDRADILLTDQYGRAIGVEVETSVDEDCRGMAGVLQAIKYRFMGALARNVTYDNSRSVLVAYRISNRVKKLCGKYQVETIEVDKETVTKWAAENLDMARANTKRAGET